MEKCLSWCAAWQILLDGRSVSADDVADGFGSFLRLMERSFGFRMVESRIGDHRVYSL